MSAIASARKRWIVPVLIEVRCHRREGMAKRLGAVTERLLGWRFGVGVAAARGS
ncbi:MAG: hypothetical protein ACLFRW_07715 [Halorhodospira sp.]